VETISKLLSNLLDYRSVIQSEDNINNRMICTVNILVSAYFSTRTLKQCSKVETTVNSLITEEVIFIADTFNYQTDFNAPMVSAD
jgi:hypothetical protein